MVPSDSIQDAVEKQRLEIISRLPGSGKSWLCKGPANRLFVVKEANDAQDPHTILRALEALYTPFRYPEPVTTVGDRCIVYPWIAGRTITFDDLLADESVFASVIELAGRVQALLRSLHLVPYFERAKARERKHGEVESDGDMVTSINFGCSPMLDREIRKARRFEVASSYKWLNESLDRWHDIIIDEGMWDGNSYSEFKHVVERLSAIHLPITGNNLSHGKFTPDHVLQCPDGRLGIVSWRIEPRPRHYMLMSFLAWMFFYSPFTDLYDKFMEAFPRFMTRAFYKENILVLNICILEQAYFFLQKPCGRENSDEGSFRDERIALAGRILEDGLLKMAAG